MIELVFTVCMALDARHCEDRSLLYQDVSLMTCMMQSQAQLAQWAATHPKWRLERWNCRILDRTAADI